MIPIVTMVDINYFPGLITLMESILQRGNLPKNQKYIVIECERISERDQNLIRSFGIDVEFLPQNDYSEVCLDWFTNWQGLQWYSWIRKMLKKLYLFGMDEYEKIIFIDCDMICMGDLNELFEKEPFAARLDYADKQAMLFDFKQFNTGLMVISPNKQDFKSMVKLFETTGNTILRNKPSSDQVIINYYFYKEKPQSLHILDPKWGVSKRTVLNPDAFREHAKDIRLLHFVGYKPWWGSEGKEYERIERNWHKVWQQAKERLMEVN